MEKKKTNPWIEHVKDVKKKHPTLQLKEVIKLAKGTYHKK
jgi:hypothetical protein